MTRRVLVCGGRDFRDVALLKDVLNGLMPLAAICHGGATGADALADGWAYLHEIPCTRYPADWGLYGRHAGPLRNRQMLAEFNPDLVVAFPGGKGTADMVRRARKAGFEVLVVSGLDVGVGDGSVQPRQPPSGVNNPDVLGGLGV